MLKEVFGQKKNNTLFNFFIDRRASAISFDLLKFWSLRWELKNTKRWKSLARTSNNWSLALFFSKYRYFSLTPVLEKKPCAYVDEIHLKCHMNFLKLWLQWSFHILKEKISPQNSYFFKNSCFVFLNIMLLGTLKHSNFPYLIFWTLEKNLIKISIFRKKAKPRFGKLSWENCWSVTFEMEKKSQRFKIQNEIEIFICFYYSYSKLSSKIGCLIYIYSDVLWKSTIFNQTLRLYSYFLATFTKVQSKFQINSKPKRLQVEDCYYIVVQVLCYWKT